MSLKVLINSMNRYHKGTQNFIVTFNEDTTSENKNVNCIVIVFLTVLIVLNIFQHYELENCSLKWKNY